MQFFKASCFTDDVILIKLKNFSDFCLDNIPLITNRFTGIGSHFVLIFDETNNFKIFNNNGNEVLFAESAIACFTKYLKFKDCFLNSKLGKINVKNLENNKTSIETPIKMIVKKENNQDNFYIVENIIDNFVLKFFIVEDCSEINIEKYKEQNLIVSLLSNHDYVWKIRTINPNSKESFACSTAFAAYNIINFLGYKNFAINYNNQNIAYQSQLNKVFQIADTDVIAEIKFFNHFLKRAL